MDPRQYSNTAHINIPYDVVQLPTQGMFYSKPIKEVKVTYLTAADENLLSSPNIISSGNLVGELLKRKIIGGEIDVNELLECDKQAILIFLRNTAYGPNYEFTLTDPSTNKTFTHTYDLSNISLKDFTLTPDEKGEFNYTMPVSNKKIKFKFLSAQDELVLEGLSLDYAGGPIVPTVTKKLELLIHEIEGERDKGTLAQYIQQMPIKDSQSFRRFVEDNQPGLDLSLKVNAPSGEVVTTNVVLGATFFRPFFGV
jgi:hypothetical protein